MATYLTEEEIRVKLDRLINKFVEECRSTCMLHPDFIELVKHNLYAKYVYYDETTGMVEIGINESRDRSPGYPDIKVYHYSLSEAKQWLGQHFRNTKFDLEFYASLISKDQDSDADIIVLDGDED